MGLNHIAIAAVIALLGAAPALHAETATQTVAPAVDTTTVAQATDTAPQASPVADTAPTPAAAPAPADDPALNASPIMGSEPAVQPAAEPEKSAPAATTGDVLTVPQTAPVPQKKKAPSAPIKIEENGMPGRGASMSQVEQRFGQPREKMAPVGTPPITRWIYGDYTVYFEHEYVIHSVRNDGSAAPAAPADTAPAKTPPATAQ